MRKTLVLGLLLLVSAAWLQAQSASSSDKGKTSDLITIEGCLQTSQGQYMLTETSGNVHRLTGADNKLKHHIGHEVEITGKQTIRTIDTSQQGIAASAAEQEVIEVKSVKHIADMCK